MPVRSVLAIETSVETGSVAFWSEGALLAERSFLAGRKPSGTLWPALEEVMQEVRSLDAIVVGIGPGSYNGSRVGIAAAQGIALVHECAVAPLCSFEGVVPASDRSLAIGDARRGSFSLQRVVKGQIEGEFELVDQEALSAAILQSHEDGREVFSFDSPERFALPDSITEIIVRRQSEAKNLVAAYFRRSPKEQEALSQALPEPFYLRDPHITIGKRKSLLD
jgi:tRNA threonylcarbamoyl adenosine modification protein YeaZ